MKSESPQVVPFSNDQLDLAYLRKFWHLLAIVARSFVTALGLLELPSEAIKTCGICSVWFV